MDVITTFIKKILLLLLLLLLLKLFCISPYNSTILYIYSLKNGDLRGLRKKKKIINFGYIYINVVN